MMSVSGQLVSAPRINIRDLANTNKIFWHKTMMMLLVGRVERWADG
jgi:hypothetical protein